jgi:hypothetical protein
LKSLFYQEEQQAEAEKTALRKLTRALGGAVKGAATGAMTEMATTGEKLFKVPNLQTLKMLKREVTALLARFFPMWAVCFWRILED